MARSLIEDFLVFLDENNSREVFFSAETLGILRLIALGETRENWEQLMVNGSFLSFIYVNYIKRQLLTTINYPLICLI